MQKYFIKERKKIGNLTAKKAMLARFVPRRILRLPYSSCLVHTSPLFFLMPRGRVGTHSGCRTDGGLGLFFFPSGGVALLCRDGPAGWLVAVRRAGVRFP